MTMIIKLFNFALSFRDSLRKEYSRSHLERQKLLGCFFWLGIMHTNNIHFSFCRFLTLFIFCSYFHCIYYFIYLQFSDILLHTEPTGPSTYKFKNEMTLCSVKVEIPKVSLVPFSFELFSTNRSFILSARYVKNKSHRVCESTTHERLMLWYSLPTSRSVAMAIRLNE